MTPFFVHLHAQRGHTRVARARLCCAATLFAFSYLMGTARADDLRVVTTIKPVHALAAQVMDGIATPKLLIKGARSPHTYALKPSDAEAVHHAHLFVRIAPWVEPFTKKIVASLPKSVQVLTLMEAPGLELLGLRGSGAFERHDHSEAHDGDDHHDGHGPEPENHQRDKGPDKAQHDKAQHATAADPHIWLDTKNAADMVRALVNELQRIAPEHKNQLEKNGAAAVARLKILEQALKTKLAPVETARFIVFHDAFQYFEKRFGLQAVGAITLHPEAPPSGKRLNEIRQKIKQVGARCVFSEPQFNARRIITVVEGTDAKTGVLDPIGTDVPSGPGAYDAMMHKLADGFVDCLKS